MPKRTLDPIEKRRIAEERRLLEISAHPDKMISVQVEDETDESGVPVVIVQFIGVTGRNRNRTTKKS